VDLTDILARPERLTQVIREELIAIREQYGDARRTEINRDHLDLSTEDLIEPQDVVVTLSHAGYRKSQPVTEYQVQRRGGRGKAATSVKDEDFVEKLFVAHTHDTILCFSNRGKVYWKRVFELPQAGAVRAASPWSTCCRWKRARRINAVLPIKQFDDDHFVFMATSQGTVKKTPLSAFSRPRASGIIALALDTRRPPGRRGAHRWRREIILSSSGGKSIRFNEEEVRPMGREATGCSRHQTRRGAGTHLADRRGRWARAHRLRQRLRQAHAARRFPAARSRRPGRHCAADHRAKRRNGRRAASEFRA
jgi:DNA gyrase subunit A